MFTAGQVAQAEGRDASPAGRCSWIAVGQAVSEIDTVNH